MEENKKNLEDIVLLEETIKLLRDQNLKKASNAVGVQTEDTERLWCIECEYPAEDLYDLGEHMYRFMQRTIMSTQNLVIIVETVSKREGI